MRARGEAVGERAADGGQRQVVVGAASECHVQIALGQEAVEHRDVGEQAVTHLARVDEGVAARRPLAVHEDHPVGEGVIVADDVGQVGVLLPAHVGQHHARCLWCARQYDYVDRRCGGRCKKGHQKRLVHRPHCGKGVRPADVLGVPHQHQLEALPVHLLPADRSQQLGARAARATGRRRCFREPPVAREAGIDYHAALRHAAVPRVALPRWRRLWRRAADQRHDRSADARRSAEHECRRAEQSEQRRLSTLVPGDRRLREALVGAPDLWRAKAGAIGPAAGCCCGQRVRSGPSSITGCGPEVADGTRGEGGLAVEVAQRGRARPCVMSAWEGTEWTRREEEWVKTAEDIWHLVVWVWRCLCRRDLDILDRGCDGLAPPRVERAGLLYAGRRGLLRTSEERGGEGG
eukprot:scaffold25484_cov51-Phaeocystis_antarctica.AAC.2